MTGAATLPPAVPLLESLAVPAERRRAVATPRRWGLRAGDVVFIVLGNAVLIVVMWVRHGQLPNLQSATAMLSAAGQLTALLGTYAALVQVVLMSRSPWLDQLFGVDRIAGWHRWLGFATVWLIAGHVVFSTAGYAAGDGRSFLAETWTFLTTYPYMLMAYAGFAAFVVIAAVSVRAARRRLTHETWHFIHLYVYLAIALSFGHQIAVGTDFERDPVAIGYWVALYVAAALLVLAFRVAIPVNMALKHDLKIHSLFEETPGVLSIYITGDCLEELPAHAGQFFKFRFLARGMWWRVHPFSLSAAPNGTFLRITVKEVGDFTGALHTLHPGTRVLVEGPYGIFTSERRTRPRTLLVAGGIGITPLRALLEELPARKGGTVLIYRARSWPDVVFRQELDQLAADRGVVVHYVVGRRGVEVARSPLAPQALRTAVPDVRERDVFICGPAEMIADVTATMTALGVPPAQVHRERFALL
ncbi:MAG: ferredoxin reductase family protein [Candidatus Dormibacteraeota bacterium]|nr:ferredoxin reductase family protein [Candidatus Dormibacteraeota bacterium]